MIIRASLRDNDYTNILEKFFSRFKFVNFGLYYKVCSETDKKSLLEYRDKSIECDNLLQKIIFNTKEMTEDEKKKFVDIVKTDISIYIKQNYSDDYEYLKNKIDVNLTNIVEDIWENGEVVYYFINKEITVVS